MLEFDYIFSNTFVYHYSLFATASVISLQMNETRFKFLFAQTYIQILHHLRLILEHSRRAVRLQIKLQSVNSELIQKQLVHVFETANDCWV